MISIQMTEEKVFWLDVMVDDMLGVKVLENVQLLESSESSLNQGDIAMCHLAHEQQPSSSDCRDNIPPTAPNSAIKLVSTDPCRDIQTTASIPRHRPVENHCVQ
jgi:hypothetical protein